MKKQASYVNHKTQQTVFEDNKRSPNAEICTYVQRLPVVGLYGSGGTPEGQKKTAGMLKPDVKSNNSFSKQSDTTN